MTKKPGRHGFVLFIAVILISGVAITGCYSPLMASGNAVYIYNNYFSPNVRTVMVNTTVVWTNYGSSSHTVTSVLPDTELNSGTLGNGASYSHTFTVAGTYDYYCAIHGMGMSGQIVVMN